MDRWDVNAIVLNHRTRFFTAAALARESLNVSKGALLSLLGNLSWAASSFHAKDREEQAAMAFGGAILGTLAPTTIERGGVVSDQLGILEREFQNRHDQIVEIAWSSLSQADMLDGSPTAINEHVWKILFPRLTYRQSLGELVEQLRDALSQ